MFIDDWIFYKSIHPNTYHKGGNPCCLSIFHFANRTELLGIKSTSPFSDPDRSITSFTEINVLLLSRIKKKTVYITVLIKITHFIHKELLIDF